MSSAKSMANQYLAAKRQQSQTNSNRFKGSVSNLASNSITTNASRLPATSTTNSGQTVGSTRLKSTSMSSLLSANSSPTGRMHRPESRSALDSIHNGMNAKYAQIQSKVLHQNIRPHQQVGSLQVSTTISKRAIGHQRNTLQPASKRGTGTSSTANNMLASEKNQLLSQVKQLQEQIDNLEAEQENLRQELEREKIDKQEHLQQLKLELAEKLAEHEKQNDEQHQKLLEAYEMADQNRRAADTVLSESRQRDEQSRSKIEELEGQLADLKEFVAMKEEMTGKLHELREQLREERERYEEQLKSLHQVFENEKISLKAELQQQQHVQKSHANGLGAAASTQSAYFARARPALDSNESLDQISSTIQDAPTGGCRKCRSGRSKLHKSEHDLLYGSRLSTRVQDGAKSAWRSTKKLASSVISGGVSISACRYKQTGPKQARYQPNLQPAPAVVVKSSSSLSGSQQNVASVSCVGPKSPSDLLSASNGQQQHTSVIQIQSNNNGINTKQQPSAEQAKEGECQTNIEGGSPSVIRLGGQNNKLTILTKFSAGDETGPEKPTSTSTVSPNQQQQANGSGSPNGSPIIGCNIAIEEQRADCAGSERSRCMSSSSGHGTNSDSGSAAGSQNGDLDSSLPNPDDMAQQQKQQVQTEKTNQDVKQHKRKSSLFKASQMIDIGKSIKSVFAKSQPPSDDQQQSVTQLALPSCNLPVKSNVEANNNNSDSSDNMSHFRSLAKQQQQQQQVSLNSIRVSSEIVEENRVPNSNHLGGHEFKFVIIGHNKDKLACTVDGNEESTAPVLSDKKTTTKKDSQTSEGNEPTDGGESFQVNERQVGIAQAAS